jgi:periplasmic protein TonB
MKRAVPLPVTASVVLLVFAMMVHSPASAEELKKLDNMPEPIGGLTAIMQQVAYPKSAIKDGMEGKVFLTVVIDTMGRVKSVEIKEGVRSDLNQAAVKAINMSNWIPAQKDGKPVESSIVVPIQFKLEKKIKK